MKKKLQQEIVSLAEKLSATETNFDTKNVKAAVHQLYEKLCVLEYLEGQLRDDETQENIESFDSKSYREKNWFSEPEPVPQPQHQEDLVEPLMEKIKDLVAQMPQESEKVDALLEEIVPKKRYVKNDLEEFASKYQQTPVFERKEQQQPKPEEQIQVKEIEKPQEQQEPSEAISQTKKITVDPDKPRSINDALNRGMNVGLNDRLAFIKHLFNDSTSDYNRVVSQINTMDNYGQAQDFIKGKVKPEYNYWLKKDEYAERFMAMVEKSFN